MEICNTEKCTGCFSCMSICPHHAISVRMDEHGKTIPIIDGSKCVQCGACVNSCPVNQKTKLNMPLRAIAAWSKTGKDIAESSSGGAAAVFSRKVIHENGVVYGAASIDRTVKHIRVSEDDSLQLLRGSKYVQSYTGTIFQSVKNDLILGKTVLFTGVPCQIAGLKSYLKKEYDNLITVDLICHGVPPIKYLQEHIEGIVTTKWDSVSFRGKHNYFLSIYEKGNLIYSKYRDYDLYFKAFSDKLIFRDNCYICPYAQPKRCSDITIGDFWGINRSTMQNKYNGRISLILSNTQKGVEFWDFCADNFLWEERTLKEAMNSTQGNLLHPSKPHAERNTFLRNYQTMGFERAVVRTQLGKEVKRNQVKSAIKETYIAKVLCPIKHKML